MLKDEASLSREKMNRIDLSEIILSVVDDFKQDLDNQNKNIKVLVKFNNKNKKNYYILGIENRIEQVIANLLDNAISFSANNQKVEIEVDEVEDKFAILIKDEGPGFSETSTDKVFNRFYSNRPKSFGEHSGLGLNIVKNIVELHKGTVSANNRSNAKGAQLEVMFPKLV